MPRLLRVRRVFLLALMTIPATLFVQGAFTLEAFAQVALAKNETGDNLMESTVAPMAASGKRSSREEIQKQWQQLLNHTLSLVTSQLSKASSFYPFAAVQYSDGQIKVVATREASPKGPPESALGDLRKELATLARNGRLLTVVYYADAAVTRKDTGLRQAGIRIKLDHASGESMEGFLPYVRDENGALKLLTPEYRPSTNVTFR